MTGGARLWLLVLPLLLGGCQAASYIENTLNQTEPGVAVSGVDASPIWRPSQPGHGLAVVVWTTSDPAHYERNLELELDRASRACAAMAGNDQVAKWAWLQMQLYVTYRGFPGVHRRINGGLQVVVERELLASIRGQSNAAAECRRRWRFEFGYKDQPDSRTVLRW